MAFWGYIRVSSDNQKTENQKLSILEHANSNNMKIDHWIEVKRSSKKSPKERKINELLDQLQTSDTLIVSELSRLGRSVGQIAMIVDELVNNQIKLICLKERINLVSRSSIQDKVMITMFSLFAEIERDLISERTKEGLARAKTQGRLPGRPKGSLGKTKLDGKEKEIRGYLAKGVNRANLAKIYNVSWFTMDNFIKTRKIPTHKSLKVKLWLRVENNNKYVRGRKRAREDIEQFCLRYYDMQKLDEDGWEYELSIPYENEKDLDRTIYHLLSEIESTADMRNCFTETDIIALDDSDRSW